MSVAHKSGCSRADVRESLYVDEEGYVFCASCKRHVAKEKLRPTTPVRQISATPEETEEKDHEEPCPEPTDVPRTEALECASCGGTWHRPVKRGRKPSRCPGCA